MGSKRSLLSNGLAQILLRECTTGRRVVDLFCGASSVSWFIATSLDKSVLACDLQQYATTMAGAVIKRREAIDYRTLEAKWLAEARRAVALSPIWNDAMALERCSAQTEVWHRETRALCGATTPTDGLITNSYGGHYFSARQAASFDAMLRTLPAGDPWREICLAATIVSASKCAASPGHTAQPFKPSPTAEKYLRQSWKRDPFVDALSALGTISSLCALRSGTTVVADANEVAQTLGPADTVFIDPPYSAVQYSRFYHVLETIARGWCGGVEGVGRYPARGERPRSSYSLKGQAANALSCLCRDLAARGCRAVVTFPRHDCSNGLSGQRVEDIAATYYRLDREVIGSRFSTLGGNSRNRRARRLTEEYVLILRAPR